MKNTEITEITEMQAQVGINATSTGIQAPCGWNFNSAVTPQSIGAEPARNPASAAEADSGSSAIIRSWSPQLVRRAASATINDYWNPVRIGTGFTNSPNGSISIGRNASGGNHSIAIGPNTRANGSHSSIAMGPGAIASGEGDIVIGGGATTSHLGGMNTAIGKQVRSTHSDAGVFGRSATSRANNQIVLGRPGISTVGFSAWSNVSDRRDKKDISPLSYDPVAFVKGLQPKQYRYDIRQCYRHIEEITEDEFDALPEYEKRHRIISMPVFGLRLNGDDGEEGQLIEGVEWIEEYAYLGIKPKEEEPTCLESLKGGLSVKAMNLGEIPRFTTLNEVVETMESPLRPTLRTTFFRDYYEALAAWKLSKCKNPQALTAVEAALPLCDPYCYPLEALRDEEGNIITNNKGEWVFAQDEDGNCTLTWPFPRKASEFDPVRVRVRTAYFHIVEDEPDGSLAGKRLHNGFIAQEVEELATSMGFDFSGVQYFGHHKDENGVPLGDDVYALATEEMTAPVVATLQHLLNKVDELEMRLANNKN
ncbi:MAG: tail fiber domain-containing protein [Defluviitaleaceae bacterium]|nr:tail fiber domain-containing protein [Defluviitaleaceae bacterium]